MCCEATRHVASTAWMSNSRVFGENSSEYATLRYDAMFWVSGSQTQSVNAWKDIDQIYLTIKFALNLPRPTSLNVYYEVLAHATTHIMQQLQSLLVAPWCLIDASRSYQNGFVAGRNILSTH